MQSYYVETEIAKYAQEGIEFFQQDVPFVKRIVSPHIHAAVELLYIQRGSFLVVSETQEYTVHAGDTVLFRPNTIHRTYSLSANSSYAVLKVYPSLILAIANRENAASYLLQLALYHQSSKVVWLAQEGEQNGMCACFQRLVEEYEHPTAASELMMKAGAAQIIATVLRDPQACPPQRTPTEETSTRLTEKLYEAIVYINRHYAEDITAESCSKHLYVSYSYFAKRFKLLTGKTFREYLTYTRINHAEKALLSSTDPITKIALDCGFNNHAYFSAVYKKLKGVSPTEARSLAKQGNVGQSIIPCKKET